MHAATGLKRVSVITKSEDPQTDLAFSGSGGSFALSIALKEI
jgi:hypothetical protein